MTSGTPRRRPLARRLRTERLEARCLLDAAGFSGTVVHDSDGDLFAVDLLGDFSLEHLGRTGEVMFDMAFAPNGELYGVGGAPEGPSELFRVDIDWDNLGGVIETTRMGIVSEPRGGHLFINGLEFTDDGIMLGSGFNSLGEEFVFSIDTETGSAQEELSLEAFFSAGDISFDSQGNLYLTTVSGNLLRAESDLSAFEVVGQLDAADFYGLTSGPAPVMYGFRWLSDVWQINPADATHTWLATLQDPLLFGVYGAATMFEAPRDLGQVDFRWLRNEQPVLGELWYEVEMAHDGFFTIDIPGAAAETGPQLTLYSQDEFGQLLELATAQQRLDVDTTAGTNYFVRVNGDDASPDVRFTNLVTPTEDGVLVHGSSDDDVLDVQIGPPTLVSINGVEYQFDFDAADNPLIEFSGGDGGEDAALVTLTDGDDGVAMEPYAAVAIGPWYEVNLTDVDQIGIFGNGGDDAAVVFGSNADEEATLWPSSTELFTQSYALYAVNMASVEIDAGGGYDTATFADGNGDDTIELWPDQAAFSGPGFQIDASNFEATTAIYMGGSDEVIFHDSSGDDRFEVSPGYAAMTGPGYVLEAYDYTNIQADGLAGGYDVAELGDTDGDDSFVGAPQYGMLTGGDFSFKAVYFEEILVRSEAGGKDTAKIFDSPGDDLFIGAPGYANLSGEGFVIQVEEFDRCDVFASSSGYDLAKLYDSPGDDHYYATPVEAALSGEGFYNRVKSFEEVHAYAGSAGFDTAILFDSPGDDLYVGTADYGALFGEGYYNRSKFFEVVTAEASTGNDIAKLYDSPGDDLFVATPTYGGLSGEGFQHHARRFDAVHAYGTAGGYDVAKLYDSPGDDLFFGNYREGALFKPGEYYNRAKWFEAVHAYGSNGGYDRAELRDSAGDDTFVSSAVDGAIFGEGFYRRAKWFEEVNALADAGGYDEAYLNDSPEADLLEAEGNWARLSNAALDFLYEAAAFDYVKATASSAADTKDTPLLNLLDFTLELEGPWQDI